MLRCIVDKADFCVIQFLFGLIFKRLLCYKHDITCSLLYDFILNFTQKFKERNYAFNLILVLKLFNSRSCVFFFVRRSNRRYRTGIRNILNEFDMIFQFKPFSGQPWQYNQNLERND